MQKVGGEAPIFLKGLQGPQGHPDPKNDRFPILEFGFRVLYQAKVQQLKGSSAELKKCRELLRIRPEIFDFKPEWGPKLGQTKPKISGTVPTDRHTTLRNDSGPISECFNDASAESKCDPTWTTEPE